MHNFRELNVGTVAIIIGIFIILAIVLPSEFWWFILAACMICYGIRIKRRK